MSVKAKIFKKRAAFLAGIFVFMSIGLLSVGPLIKEIAKVQLRKVFQNSAVTVKSCVLKPQGLLILSGIEVKNANAYDFVIREVKARFSLFSLIGGRIPEIDINGVIVRIDTPQKKIAEFPQYLSFSSGKGILIEQINISAADIDITSRDIGVKAKVSASLNIPDQILNSLEITIDSCSAYNVLIEGLRFSVKQKDKNGGLSIQEICYNNKLTIRNISGSVFLRNDILFLNGVAGQLFGGEISTDIRVRFVREFDYLVNVRAQAVSLVRIVEDFELKDKFQMGGVMAGEIGLRGKGPNIQFLNADFSVLPPGGTLIITDTKFLDLIAKSSQQYVDAVTESFKNYSYSIGTARVYKEEQSYVLDVALDGEQGKRNFKIIVDFKA